MLAVYYTTYVSHCDSVMALRFPRQTHTDHLQRICAEHRYDSRERSGCESPNRRLLLPIWDDNGANLLVSQKLDATIGEDPKQCSTVAAKQSPYPICAIDVPNRPEGSRPRPSVLLKLWIVCLK